MKRSASEPGLTSRYREGVKGGKLIFYRSSAKQIFTQKFESPGVQIEHQINRKVDASSRGIQSRILLRGSEWGNLS